MYSADHRNVEEGSNFLGSPKVVTSMDRVPSNERSPRLRAAVEFAAFCGMQLDPNLKQRRALKQEHNDRGTGHQSAKAAQTLLDGRASLEHSFDN